MRAELADPRTSVRGSPLPVCVRFASVMARAAVRDKPQWLLAAMTAAHSLRRLASPRPHPGIRSVALVVLTVLALGGFVGRAQAATVVSLTFDDGRATQTLAGPILQSHGMHGTFYVNSIKLGTSSYYMTWSDVGALAANGNEVGGHTLDHPDLTTVSTDDATRQVCDDRSALVAHGYPARSFAYPYGSYNSTIEAIVKSCGYQSARTVWGAGCSGCPTAEAIPPPDVFALRAPPSIPDTTTVADLEKYVTDAEAAGDGWLTLTFHSICSGCDSYSTSEATLKAFLDWLQPRAAMGTIVKTVGAVIDGSTAGLQPRAATGTIVKTVGAVIDGSTGGATAHGSSPADHTAPRIAIGGLRGTGRQCVRRSVVVRIRARDPSGVRRVRVYLDRRQIHSSASSRLRVRIPARLRPGRHRFTVLARDNAGNRSRRSVLFSRCGRRV
jgi:peptidoglycan/xylan/chitin deacetylase (PgdA/CDA1 family)